MPDCQSNNGPVATATPSRANNAGNIVVAGGRTRQKQTKKQTTKTHLWEKTSHFQSRVLCDAWISLWGNRKPGKKCPAETLWSPHTHHHHHHHRRRWWWWRPGPPAFSTKKRSRHTSRGVSSITAPLQQSRRAAGGQYGTAESSPALCSDHQSPVTAHSIEILIAASEASRLQKLCPNLFVVQLANSNIYFSRRRRHKNVAVYWPKWTVALFQ